MDSLPRSSPRRPRRGRLSRSAEFERVYRQGRSHGNRYLVLYHFPRATGGEREVPRLGLSVSRKVGGAVERNRVKRLLREAFDAEGAVLAPESDIVIVARPEAGELAEREGLQGVRAALAELVGKVGDGGLALMNVSRRALITLIRGYQKVSAVFPRRCRFEPTCSGTPRKRSYGSAYCAAWCSPCGGCCAAIRSTMVALTPSMTSGSLPPGRAAHHPAMIPVANIFQPLVDAFNSVIVFFHDDIGLGWGMSIIVLTIVVRALMLPVAFKQYSSMRGMQEAAPEIKRLQAKYKDDKQRLQQETMKFYKDNQINPFASCLPLVMQLPVFLALFYALRTDLREDMCNGNKTTSCHQIAEHMHLPAGHFGEKFLFIPDITDKATGWVLAVLVVIYIGTQLASSLLMMTAATDKNQRLIFLGLPFFMTLFILRFPAGLLVYWITTNSWTIGQQQIIKRILGPPKLPEKDPDAPTPSPFAVAKAAITGDEPVVAKATAVADTGRTKAPPPPPRRKRKRSGKRR